MNKLFYSEISLCNRQRKRRLMKTLIKMKLTGLLIVASMFASYATTKGQVSLQVKNEKLSEVLETVTKQTGVRFVYEKGLLANQYTTLKLNDASLSNSLDQMLKSKGFSYSLVNNSVIIKRSGRATVGTAVQQQRFSGKVQDGEGNGLANVTIREVGTNNVVQSDDSGNFTINLSSKDAQVDFRLIGFQNRRVSYSSTVQTIVLESDANTVDEVVVVGFGKQTKASVVGAISTVSAKELKVPTSTLSNAFAGRISGVVAVQRGAEPGADGSNFWVRGVATFAGPSQPLIFIDGIESTTADMNNLAPEVIDNFSLLKDASATALYGARGANGVLLITTKRGGDFDKARINFRIENAIASPTKPVKMSNAVDYMEGYNYALTNRGLEPRFDEATKIEPTRQGLDPLAYPDVDWYSTLFKDYSMNQYANLNVAGGGSKADYFVSATFNNDNGILRKDQFNDYDNNIKIKRYNLIANVGVNLTNNTKAVIRLNSRLDDYNGANMKSSDLYGRVFLAPPALFQPTFPANVENPDHIFFGNQIGGPHLSNGAGVYYNPYADMVLGYRETFGSTNMAALDITQKMDFLLKGLTFKGLISYKNFSETHSKRFSSPYYYSMKDFKEVNGHYEYTYENVSKGTTALSSEVVSTGDRLMNLNFIVDWVRQFGKHGIAAMMTYSGRSYTPSNPGTDPNATGSISRTVPIINVLPTRNQGIAGRLNYQYDSKYFLEFNFGYNGSEVFKEGDRFGFFPSLAAGYMISNEKFWEPIKPVVNSFKVRGSWGIVGNELIYDSSDKLVRFPYMEVVNLNGREFTFGQDWQTRMVGPSFSRLGTESATWEQSTKYNVGFDLAMFNDKLSLTADFFKENRDGIFMQRRVVPAEVGVVGLNAYANLGRVYNSGFDANLSYQHTFTNQLYVNVRGTFTYAKNKFLAVDEPSTLLPYESQVGRPLDQAFGYIAEGYYKDEQDVANSPLNTLSQNLMPGDIKYKDLNDDGKIDANDRTYYGNPSIPQIIYGFGVSSSYKGFDASFFFQGAAKTSLSISGIHPYNNSASALLQYLVGNYWTEDNTNAMYPRLITGMNEHSNFRPSTHWLRDGSFIRLKNAEVGYTYKFARLFVSGQNLLTFSKFKLWDVELGSGNGLRYPNNRVISIGGQLNF